MYRNQSKNQKMNKIIIKMKLFALGFLITSSVCAQQKLTKLSQSISVDKDVTIDLNTSHCNIVFDTWNKGTIEIEAYIEGEDLSDEELQEALKDWDVDVEAAQDLVSIRTKGNAPHVWAYRSNGDSDAVHAVLEELKFELADLPEMNFDFHFEMPEMPEMPEMREMPEMPEMPEMQELPELPKLPKGVKSFRFDYDAYKKDGEKYLEEYTQKFESTYGEDYAKKMEAWGEKFGKEWGEKYGKDIAKWAEKFEGKWDNEEFEKKMEAWGERFAAKMEQQEKRTEEQQKRIEKAHEAREKMHEERQERLEKVHEERERIHERISKEREKHAEKREKLTRDRRVLIEKLVNKESNSKVKKTIKIKMPKGAKLKVNVRHGELKFAANIDNLKADLSHTKFTAYSVNGSSTSINASYSPVYVTHWNLGELNLNYVKKAELNNVKQMVLTSNSSNIKVQNLIGNAIIDGSIGDLKILKIDDAFTNLNVILQNSDATITLPKVDHNLHYSGNRSRFSHPEKSSNENVNSFTSNNSTTGKTIVVNAKYSNITMQ